MLAKLEDAYLNLLRVAILVVAGLVLLGAAAALTVGLVDGAKSLLSSTSVPEAGDLARFIAEKRLTAEMSSKAGSSKTAKPPEPVALAPAIDHAAAIIARYVSRNEGERVTKGELVEGLNELWLNTPENRRSQYEVSLRRIADQLAASTGRPLGSARVAELVTWHHQTLLQQVQQLEADRQATGASAWTWIGRAAQAFLLFVAIAFYFLLVRVERHLRLVRTQAVASDAPVAMTENQAL